MLTSACANALLSLMPIPTIATTLPCCCNSFTKSALWAGNYKEMALLKSSRLPHHFCKQFSSL
jgi:hypothetical protein